MVTPRKDGWIYPQEAAAILNVSRHTLRRWRSQGRLQGRVRIGRTLGGHTRLWGPDVEALARLLTHHVDWEVR
jgi:excisionase family DNA binding protein